MSLNFNSELMNIKNVKFQTEDAMCYIKTALFKALLVEEQKY